MKRLALYARVSGDKQEREETIDSQLAQLRTLAAQKEGLVLERHVYLDDGYSGDLLARPGFAQAGDVNRPSPTSFAPAPGQRSPDRAPVVAQDRWHARVGRAAQ